MAGEKIDLIIAGSIDYKENYFEIQKYDTEILSFQKEISAIEEKLKEQMGLEELKQKLSMIQNKIEEQEKVLGEKIIAKESKKQLAEMKSLEKVTTTSTKETKEEKEVEKPKEIKKKVKDILN